MRRLKRVQPGERPSAKDWNDLVEAVEALSRMSGSAPVRVSMYDGVPSVSLDLTPEASQFFARIASATPVSGVKQWTYAFVEVEKTDAGYGEWTDKSGGLTGTLMNLIEDQNGASGLYGNGVNSSNLIGTFDIQPIPDDTRVLVTKVTDLEDGSTEYWTQYENGIDGACS